LSKLSSRGRDFDIIARRWLAKTARKNLWRVAAFYDLDDLISEGLLCWQIIICKYPKVDERKHLMALFQRTYINRLHQLAKKRSRQVEEVHCEPPDRSDDDSEMVRLVYSAPEALRKCLLVILDNPALLQRPQRVRRNGTRETLNEYLCSFVKVDPAKNNLHRQLLALLKPNM
jgi:hypothetical protein